MSHARAFTWLEAVVVLVIAIIAFAVVSLLIPGMGRGHRVSPSLINNTQLRGIQQGMVIYAQSNKLPGNYEGFYPGLNPDGTHANIRVEDRFLELLNANAFTPEYIINPTDSRKTPYDMTAGGPLTTDHYSYAMLQVPTQGGRHDEWRETINTAAIVLADRNTGTAAQPESVWSGPANPWHGTTARNDNSTFFESTHILDGLRYGSIDSDQDHLFEPTSDDDAYLIYNGN